MRKIYGRIKQLSILVGVAILLTSQPAFADAIDEPYLINIQNYTNAIQTTSNSILSSINTMFTYLTQLSMMATSFLATDNGADQPIDWSTNWGNQQNWLASLSSNQLTNEENQHSMQQSLLTNFFGSQNIQATPPNPLNINDLSYTSLLGQLLVSPDPRSGADPAMNYLLNASGLAIPLTTPSPAFRGDAVSQKNYVNFYNTMTAAQTYNGFALSALYQDSKTEANDRSLRKQLITQSSNSDWFSSIIANDLGWVLRQILLYDSQMFVLMDQLVKTQKQMAATLAVTNTLFIVSNELQGNILLKQAKGT